MLKTRLWMGAILIALAVGALWVDQLLAPWYPFLLVLILVLAVGGCLELLHLLDAEKRPSAWICNPAVIALIVTNWLAPPEPWTWMRGSWPWIGSVFAGVVLVAFLFEMATFQAPGTSVIRIALAVWIAAYLGLLPCFLAQLRWLSQNASVALALAIFVPKMGDTGAYFTGRLIGKHRMAPVLSPKKTWEGAAGAIVAAILVTVGINRLGPALSGGLLAEVGFGVTVGVIGLLGDLAESLVKRDCQAKDASAMMPGFGGVLDVVDSIVFAAPVAYWWLH